MKRDETGHSTSRAGDATPVEPHLLLVIEDNPGDARIVKEALSGSRFDVEVADRLETGLSRLAGGGVDVVVLDLELPDSRGLDGLTKVLASVPPVPVVVVTGSADETVGRSAVAAGAQDFIVKGRFDPDSLARALKYAVERHRLLAELQEANEVLQAITMTDALTGLSNRRRLDDDLQFECASHDRYGGSLSLLMIDVDHFKPYNDSFGHQAGDAALQAVGRILAEGLRSTDRAYRYGGEEFTLILRQTTSTSAVTVAEGLRRAVEQYFVGSDPLRPITISIGVATLPEHGATPEALAAAADSGLYEAKHGGRNRVKVADARSRPAAT